MSQERIEVRVSEKEAANYFSNAAALYVLGVGFAVFAAKAHGPFMSGVCFWFSIFMLCDCFRLARVCRRLDGSGNLVLSADRSGFTHFVSWLEPEHRRWKDITSYRIHKTPYGETCYFVSRPTAGEFLRYAFFGSPKFDLPLSGVPGGKEGLLKMLESFPDASHLLPERATAEPAAKAA